MKNKISDNSKIMLYVFLKSVFKNDLKHKIQTYPNPFYLIIKGL